MKINNFKKYGAILGLTSFVLLNGCGYNNSEVETNGKFMNEEVVKKVDRKLDCIHANYDYEDKYMTENALNLFIVTDKYERECGVTVITDEIDTMVRGIIPRMEAFSKFVCENLTTSSDLYTVEDFYNDPYKFDNKTFYKILYNLLTKMFENEEQENWNSLSCKLSNTAIVFSNNHIIDDNRTAQTEYVDIRSYELGQPIFGTVVIIDEENIDKLAMESSSYNNSSYEDIYMNLFYDALSHEIVHCEQNNCSCYYLDYRYLNHVNRLINLEKVNFKSEFLSEAGAVVNGNKYYETKEFLNQHNLYTGYNEEIDTTKLLESAILLRDDYNVSDIYDNSVSSNPQKLCDWFDVDIVKVKNLTFYDDYVKMFNMLTVLNASNSNNRHVFDWIVDKQYGSTNNMNAKKMLLRSDAVIDLMVCSYRNLIKFNENNYLSKEAFKYLVNNYQNYYLSQAEFINDFDGKSYWSNEFRMKFDLANGIINEYIEKKYKSNDSVVVELELKSKLGDKYDVFMSNIVNDDDAVRDKYNDNLKPLDDIANVGVIVKKKEGDVSG